MADQAENADVDFDDLQAFVEIVTRDQQAVVALRASWDARWLMLFLVSLTNQGIPDAAYLLSKLYSRGIVRPPMPPNLPDPTMLISANSVKAAVWT